MNVLAISVLIAAGSWPDPVPLTVRDTEMHGQQSEIVDIDGDNDQDLLTSYSLTDRIVLELNDGNENFSRVVVGDDIVGMFAMAADLDRDLDGDLDIAAIGLFDRTTGFDSAGLVIWYERDASVPVDQPGAWIPHPIDTTLIHPRYLQLADLDRDGDTDLAVISIGTVFDSSFPGVVRWYENRLDTNGDFLSRDIDTNVTNPNAISVADLDGINGPDLVVAELAGGRVSWYQNDGTGGFTRRSIDDSASNPQAAHACPLAGPGSEQVVTISEDSVGSGEVRAYSPDGMGGWTGSLVVAVAGVDFECADLDGNGELDVVAGSFLNGSVDVHLRDGVSIDSRSYPYFSFSGVDVSDIDGDGDLDFTTANYDSHRVDWWRNDAALTNDAIFDDGFE